MNNQLSISFSVHPVENLPENQAILDAHKEAFSKQCKTVYEILKSGVKLTVRSAMDYGIGDLRARVRDLKKFNHIDVKYFFLEDGRSKCWYL